MGSCLQPTTARDPPTRLCLSAASGLQAQLESSASELLMELLVSLFSSPPPPRLPVIEAFNLHFH